MEIYSFVDYDNKHSAKTPSVLRKRISRSYSRTAFESKRERNQFSFDNPWQSCVPAVKPDFSIRVFLASVGRKLTSTGDFFKNNAKAVGIAAMSVVIAATLATGAIIFVNYSKNHVSNIVLESNDTDRINALMATFAMDNYGEYTEDGDVLGQDVPHVQIVQPVSFQNYTVRSGDTISGITKKFGLYNISTLISVNNISNARQLYVGKKLRIPNIDGIEYKVSKGDSLASIAKKNGISVEDLVDCNELDSEILTTGQVLYIPGGKMDPTALKNAMGELFMNPLKIKYRISSEYGYRLYPLTGTPSNHSGIDLACATGTPVYATKSGTVAYVCKNDRVYGNYVIINHGNGYQTLYAHMSKITCVKGQSVDNNTKIGLVGSTGQSTGPHLHFSVFKNGSHINPRTVLPKL